MRLGRGNERALLTFAGFFGCCELGGGSERKGETRRRWAVEATVQEKCSVFHAEDRSKDCDRDWKIYKEAS